MKKKRNRQNLWYGSMPNFLLKMKLLSFLIFVTVATVTANSYSQQAKFSMNFENVSVRKVFQHIEENSEFILLYSEKSVDVERKVNVNVANQTVEKILDQVFMGTKNYYEIHDRQIAIMEKGSTEKPFFINKTSEVDQQKSVSGKVSDSSGEPLPGVSVVLKGTTTGTITDADGKYNLDNVPSNAMLQFSFVGMKTQEIPVSGQTIINVILSEDAIGIEEVVAVGYGTVKKIDLTGSVSIISAEKLKELPVATVDQKIKGQLPGVRIQQITGIPGGGTSVQIRGVGSLGAGNEPLYVVDGIPYSAGSSQVLNPLIQINPNDIESITVLKDASSTAIYGSRGANGVIIIATKKGNYDKTEVNISSMSGIATLPQKGRPQMMNAREFAEYQKEVIDVRIRATENREPTINDYPTQILNPEQLTGGTDWYGMLFRQALVQDHSVSIEKGSHDSRQFLSFGYYNQEGVMKYTGIERYNVKLNMDSKLGKKVIVGASLNPSFINQDRTYGTDNGRNDFISTSLWLDPISKAYDDNGNLIPFISSWANKYISNFRGPNPLNALKETISKYKEFSNVGSGFFQWEIIPGLIAKSQLSTIWKSYEYTQFVSSTVGSTNTNPVVGNSSSTKNTGTSFNWLIENTVTYDRQFGKNHHLTALVGYTVQEARSKGVNINAYPYANDLIKTINAAQGIKTWGEDFNEWSMISYLGRINYVFKDKYLLTSTMRADGSSRFGKNNRFAYFPSFAGAWRISEEEFLKNSKMISSAKLRLSYGESGNNNIGNYYALGSVNTGSYVINDKLVSASFVGLSNPDLAWEESVQIDAGIDIGILKERVRLNLDYYNRKSINMLLSNLIPTITGFGSQTVNKGNVRNNGFEIGLSGTPVLTNDFSWNINLNLALNQNKIISMNDNNDRILSGDNYGFPTHISTVGHPIAQFFGFVIDGILTAEDIADPNVPKWVVNQYEGDFRYRDINGDGVITDIDDYAIIGNPHPDVIYGLSNAFSYKSLSLSINVDGQIGGDVIDGTHTETDFMWGRTNVRKEWVNRWKSPSDPGDGKHNGVQAYPVGYNWKVSNLWVEDASFLRISNIMLAFTLPEGLVKRSGFIRNCRVYSTVQNLVTFTAYRGANPEAHFSKSDNTLTPGWDNSTYPLARTVSFGINVTL